MCYHGDGGVHVSAPYGFFSAGKPLLSSRLLSSANECDGRCETTGKAMDASAAAVLRVECWKNEETCPQW